LRKLQEKNLTQSDVTSAVNAQALVFPSGTVKLGPKQYQVDVNTFPLRIDSLNELPIKTIDGATIRVGDVAQVRDGNDPKTNIVRQDGVRSVLMVLLKNGNASTLSVVAGAKQAMANVLKTVSSAVRVKEFSDQSVFVRAAISGVVREGVIAGALTALMILLFLRSRALPLRAVRGGSRLCRNRFLCLIPNPGSDIGNVVRTPQSSAFRRKRRRRTDSPWRICYFLGPTVSCLPACVRTRL